MKSGRLARKSLRKQLLTSEMKLEHLKWAYQHKTWTKEQWRKVIFIDESHFEVPGHRVQYVSRSLNKSISAGHIEQRVKHPPKVMFRGSFGSDGPIQLVPMTGMINS